MTYVAKSHPATIPNALGLASLKKYKENKSYALFSKSERDRDRKKNLKCVQCAMCNDIVPTEKKHKGRENDKEG